MSLDFGQDQPEGALRGFRALLGWARPMHLPFHFPRFMNALAVIAILIPVAIDSGIYNSSYVDPKNAEADAAPWVVYGTNIAALLALFYFCLRILLACAPTQFYDDASKEPESMPRLGSVVWVFYTVATPAVWTSLILYSLYARKLTGYRQSQEVRCARHAR